MKARWVRTLKDMAEAEGLEFVRCEDTGHNHAKLWLRKDGYERFITVAGSPSDHRQMQNTKGDMRQTQETWLTAKLFS